MKTYLEDTFSRITITETKQKDEWTKIVDLKYLQVALKGFQLLGKTVKQISVQYVFIDIDTKYYHRFEESFMDRFYRYFTNNEVKVSFKNGRLYTEFEGKEIILPDEMRDSYSDYDNKELTITIKFD